MALPDSVELPLLPLRDVVVYPNMVLPLFVGREKSIAALEHAMASDKQIILAAQRVSSEDDPGFEEIYHIGTVSNILQLLKLPDRTIKVLVEGGYRASIQSVYDKDGFLSSNASPLLSEELDDLLSEKLIKSTTEQFEKYVNLSKKVPSEVLSSLSGIDDLARLTDTIAAHLVVDLKEKQKILEISDIQSRITHLSGLMDAEIDQFQVEKRIRGRVKKQMEKSQREYYLNEQMKAIQKELGDLDDVPTELDDLNEKINAANMPSEAKEKALSELK